MIPVAGPQDALRFMCEEGRVDAGVFIDFPKRMIRSSERKVFLIADGHPAHRARKVRGFVESVRDLMEPFCLPPYSPELSPDELVWNDLENNALRRKAITGLRRLKREMIPYLRIVQKTQEQVRSYLRHPSTQCVPT